MRKAGGHEFEPLHPRTRIFRVKNHMTCDLRVCEGLPGIFKKNLRGRARPFSPGSYYQPRLKAPL
jgi:hypothetical protein